MSQFASIALAPEDPIFRLNAAFLADQRPHKVNLGIGVYRAADLKAHVLECVKKAEALLLNQGLSKEYLPIAGDGDYLRLQAELLFENASALWQSGCLAAFQTVGGTGAVRLAADLCAAHLPNRLVCLPNFTWDNHKPTFQRAGCVVEEYAYFDPRALQLHWSELCAAVASLPAGAMILLHPSCHNPTGCDPSREQWRELSRLIKKQGVVAFFDCAYQGLGQGLEEDVFAIRLFQQEGHEFLVAASNAKNFGLYGERVGALYAITRDKQAAQHLTSQVKCFIRNSYSNPPIHGARLVRTILSANELKQVWLQELLAMRERIHQMRQLFTATLEKKWKNGSDLTPLYHQKGLFSFLGLSATHAQRLVEEFAIYLPHSGRLNICGLNQTNLEYVTDAIVTVLMG